ncbi:unnamed protein product [Rhizophagus irregularis]|nr:unnamed protein product [Rhizophagus irregularis]
MTSVVEIGRGGFGVVSKANLANIGLVALKIIISKNSNELNESNDDFVKELKLLREIEDHPKINRFLGITKDSDYYILVLEYANEGNLRDYLKKKFTYLRWNDKIQMALDITGGLKFIHSKEIIHRDLHSKNILVNNGKLLIADFGLSKNDIDDFYITSDRLNLNSRNNQHSRQNEKHQKNYEENNIRIVNVLLVIAVPAEFSENAKAIMRICTFNAGLIKDECSTNLQFITESEAVAAYCMENLKGQNLAQAGTNFMVK